MYYNKVRLMRAIMVLLSFHLVQLLEMNKNVSLHSYH